MKILVIDVGGNLGQYAGLLQMLPRQADPVYGDLFEINTWAALRNDDSLAPAAGG